MRIIITAFLYAVTIVVLFGCGSSDVTSTVKEESCTTSQSQLGTTISCPDGTTATVTNGTNGLQGAAGVAGAAGTVITVVQFCPGVTPSYPSTFPEVAFCIGGTLYGILNNNEAYQYLTSLPNGRYGSEGQGAPCSFNISGCNVTY